MKTINSKDFFSLKDKDCYDNQMIRFVISNQNFLIPDLYSSFKGQEFFVKSSKNELKKFSEGFENKYKKSLSPTSR